MSPSKYLKQGISSNRAEDVIRFRREAGVVSKLRHPNLVEVYETGENDGLHYLVMEYIDGLPLDEFVKRSALSLDQSLKFVIQMTEALDYVHDAGVIHRDLKPGNLMVEINGDKQHVKILDFGLAQMMELTQRRGAPIRYEDKGSRPLISLMLVSFVIAFFFASPGIASLPSWSFYLGIGLMIAGIVLRQWSIAVLGRYFSRTVGVQEGQAVVDRGPYRLVRHPSYTGLLR